MEEKNILNNEINTVEDNKTKHGFIGTALTYLPAIICGVAIALLVRIIVHPVTVSGESMYPTLKDGEVYLSSTNFDSEDLDYDTIIVFKPSGKVVKYIKRIVALPGDTVEVKDGYLYVNGQINDTFGQMNSGGFIQDNPITLEDDQYFVLGDNRNNSEDSRFLGPVEYDQITNIVGKRLIRRY